MGKAAKPVPEGFQTMTPQLTLDSAATTIDWYMKALGAKEIRRSIGPDGKIMHAELTIGNARFIANDAMMGSKGPKEYGGSPASWWIYVEDCDALFNKAVSAGAKVQMPMEDQFWGDRAGAIVDPEGFTWWIATRKEDLTSDEIQKRMADLFKQPEPTR
jgi:PhnB protein